MPTYSRIDPHTQREGSPTHSGMEPNSVGLNPRTHWNGTKLRPMDPQLYVRWNPPPHTHTHNGIEPNTLGLKKKHWD